MEDFLKQRNARFKYGGLNGLTRTAKIWWWFPYEIGLSLKKIIYFFDRLFPVYSPNGSGKANPYTRDGFAEILWWIRNHLTFD